jgi:hypothetical protein
MTEQTTTTPWRRRFAPYLPTLAATAKVALLCNLAIELSRLTTIKYHLWDYKTPTYPLLFLLGTGVVWLLVGLVHAVVGRLRVTAALVATATAVVVVVDHEKVRLRGEPLFPSDMVFAGNVGFLSQMLGARVLLVAAVVVLLAGGLTLAALAAVGSRLARHRPEQRPWYARLGLRALVSLLCSLALVYLSQFNAPGNAARGAYDLLGASWGRAGPQATYLGNGFVGAFLYNLDVPAISRPRGYSGATMARIIATYTAAARRINRQRDADALDDVNVVMILSETFSDPTQLAGVELPDDPIPFTRRLMSRTTSGSLLTPALAGKTANVEFEALTGMSMSGLPAQLHVPYNGLVPHFSTFPSAVGWWKTSGRRAVAIHPHTTELYRRPDVYRIFGFDEFVHEGGMEREDHIGHDAFISDEAAFDELLHQLESDREPVFVKLVTMQNHMPYADRYDDPVDVTTSDGEPLTDLGHYVRGLSHTDAALEQLIGELRDSPERTVVAFYGDHLPAGYPASVHAANGRLGMHRTPFFVWANFPGPVAPQPTTSPIQLMPLALERADAPVAPYYALLDELRRHVPAFDLGIRIDAHDRPAPLGTLFPEAARVLHDYRLVQYDLTAGKRYSEAAMFGPAPGASPAPDPAPRDRPGRPTPD